MPGRVAGASPKATGSKAGSRRLIILGSLLAAAVGSVVAAVVVVGWPMWQERAHWQSVSCGDGESVRRYQQAYPGGRYQSEAETCLADEKKRKAEAARLAAEVEKKRKAEVARLAAEVEKKREAEAARLAAEVEKKRKAEDARLAVEAVEKTRLEDSRICTAVFGQRSFPGLM